MVEIPGNHLGVSFWGFYRRVVPCFRDAKPGMSSLTTLRDLMERYERRHNRTLTKLRMERRELILTEDGVMSTPPVVMRTFDLPLDVTESRS